MHHYGEDAVDVNISGKEFEIRITNHKTGAKITITGPVKGVFEDPTETMDRRAAGEIGRELAHKFREVFAGVGAGTAS